MTIIKILILNLKKIVFKVTFSIKQNHFFSEIKVGYIKVQYTTDCSIYTRQHLDVHKFLTAYPCCHPQLRPTLITLNVSGK